MPASHIAPTSAPIWLIAALLCSPSLTLAQAPDLLRTDSASPYVHRLTLYDESGTAISPRDEPAAPYSPSATCAKCHEYGVISSGWHFSAAWPGHDPGRRGEPWIFLDRATGSQVPLSMRAWPGTYRPEALGVSDWEFINRFGRHLPGGGAGEAAVRAARAAAAEPNQPAARPKEPASRWDISGDQQIDCMVCHAAGQLYDAAEAARQLERQNLRWAPTAALGLAVIRGDAAKLPDNFDPLAPPNPDRPDLRAPQTVYDAARFDADDRVLFDITSEPGNDRCLHCHTNLDLGLGRNNRWQHDGDVHLARGMRCIDCHRHGIGHDMVRGYQGEQSANLLAGALTCRGCHLGDAEGLTLADRQGGRLGAPRPAHRGIPELHFESMSCTACHSGPWPQDAPRQFQTSMAHGLGIPTKSRSEADLPGIVAPVFLRDEHGVIHPHRLTWPAVWGRLAGEQFAPATLEEIRSAFKTAGVALARDASSQPAPLSDEQIAGVLAALEGAAGRGAYIRDGRLLTRGDSGQIENTDAEIARAYAWPLAHDVRPASQSLGVRGCTDCHEAGAPFFAGAVLASSSAGPPAGDAAKIPMIELMDYDRRIAGLLARGLVFKDLLLVALGLCGLLCALLLAWMIGRGFNRLLVRTTP